MRAPPGEGARRPAPGRRRQPRRPTGGRNQRGDARAPARGARGENKANVLEALKEGPLTAGEIAKVTGIGADTVSTMLNKLAKSGELTKAERGYQLPPSS